MNDLNLFRMDQLFTAEELQRLADLYQDPDAVKKIEAEVISPNIDRINKTTGQENDPRYLAYVCVYVMSGMFHTPDDEVPN